MDIQCMGRNIYINIVYCRRRGFKKTTKFWTYVQIRSTLHTLYPNMDKDKFWTSTLVSTLPTYPKSLDILE